MTGPREPAARGDDTGGEKADDAGADVTGSERAGDAGADTAAGDVTAGLPIAAAGREFE